jgi:hypothetical protein
MIIINQLEGHKDARASMNLAGKVVIIVPWKFCHIDTPTINA